MFTFFHGCGIPPVTVTCPGGAHAQNVGPTGTQGCTIPQTWFHTCGIPPVTLTCNQGGQAQAQAHTVPPQCVPNTIGCTAITPCPTINPPCGPQTAPPHCVPPSIGCTAITPCPTRTAQAQTLGETGWLGCREITAHAQNVGPTGTYGCTQPGHCVGPTGTQRCTAIPNCVPQTIGCTAITPCPTSPAQANIQTTIGKTGWAGCSVPPNCLGPTGTQGCVITGSPDATVCQNNTAQAQNLGPTGTQGCTQPGHCVGQTGWLGCTVPPHCFGPTGTQGCTAPTGSYATVCPATHVPGCDLPPTGSNATICPPTRVPGCPDPNAQAQNLGPTAWLGCQKTIATVCTQIDCGPTHLIGCTGYHGCLTPTGTPPATVCPGGDAQAQTLGPTAWRGCQKTIATVCTQIDCGPTHLIGCTGYQGCLTPTGTPPATVCPGGDAQAQNLGPTAWLGCHQHGTAATLCTQPSMCGGETKIGCTGYEGCQKTIATVCTQIDCGPTHLIGCTGYEGCIPPTGSGPATVCPGGDAQAQTLGHTAYEGCGQHGTEATLCTQPPMCGGPTHLIGCTGYEGCHSDGNAQAQIHSIPVADCIPTRHCTGAWPVC